MFITTITQIAYFIEEYREIIIFFFITTLISTVLSLIAILFLSKIIPSDALSEYECGFDPFDDATRQSFDAHYYTVGILFLIFNIEIIDVFSWVLNIKTYGQLGYWTMILFLFLLVVGFLYELFLGVLKWLRVNLTPNLTLSLFSSKKNYLLASLLLTSPSLSVFTSNYTYFSSLYIFLTMYFEIILLVLLSLGLFFIIFFKKTSVKANKMELYWSSNLLKGQILFIPPAVILHDLPILGSFSSDLTIIFLASSTMSFFILFLGQLVFICKRVYLINYYKFCHLVNNPTFVLLTFSVLLRIVLFFVINYSIINNSFFETLSANEAMNIRDVNPSFKIYFNLKKHHEAAISFCYSSESCFSLQIYQQIMSNYGITVTVVETQDVWDLLVPRERTVFVFFDNLGRVEYTISQYNSPFAVPKIDKPVVVTDYSKVPLVSTIFKAFFDFNNELFIFKLRARENSHAIFIDEPGTPIDEYNDSFIKSLRAKVISENWNVIPRASKFEMSNQQYVVEEVEQWIKFRGEWPYIPIEVMEGVRDRYHGIQPANDNNNHN